MPKTKKPKVSNFRLLLSAKDKAFILAGTRRVLSGSRWTLGPMGKEFEDIFKKYTGSSHAIALSNGGVALVALLQALEIPEGSIVICPTLTAPPTPHAILEAKMKVVFADSGDHDLGLDPRDVESKIRRYGKKVRAVITVHVGGWMSPAVHELKKICARHSIPLIEDCAHAHGSWLGGRHAGTITGLAAYSFFMTKPLTSGEGGMVTVARRDLADKIRLIRNYGKNEAGQHVMIGFNYKLSEFHAAVALWAVRNAARLAQERRKIAARYDQLLRGFAGLKIFQVTGCLSSYYKYIVLVDSRKRNFLKRDLLRQGVEPSGGVYDVLCHEEPYFRSIPGQVLNVQESFPMAEGFARRQLCLPLYPGLTEEEQKYVCRSLFRSLNHG